MEEAVCYEDFTNGPGRCKNNNCTKRHDLDFMKIERGLCFHEFNESGSCKRKRNCWFSHEIPSELRHNNEDKEKIKKLRNRMKIGKNKSSEIKENNEIKSHT